MQNSPLNRHLPMRLTTLPAQNNERSGGRGSGDGAATPENCSALSSHFTTTSISPRRPKSRVFGCLAGPYRNVGGTRRGLVDDIAGADAAGLCREGGRAGNLLERDARVVGAPEPVEAPVAARLERGRKLVAVGARRDTAVALAPAVGRRAVLVRAGVELAVWER